MTGKPNTAGKPDLSEKPGVSTKPDTADRPGISDQRQTYQKPALKRLIICCDGTWQSSVSGTRNIPSNVTRLARTIAKAGIDEDRTIWQQVVYYDAGVGTGSLQIIEAARQGASGDGLVINILEAYNFLVNNYNPGDQIFCFGFSRGAFTARCIAGLVTDIGIFKPDKMQSFASLWAAYQTNTSKHEFQVNEPYILKPYELAYGTDNIWPNSHGIEVLGCFDTVGSLGLGDTRFLSNAWSRHRFEYLNVKLSPYVKHAFHALALDEHRETFIPTLFYIPNAASLAAEEAEIDKEDDDWPELKAFRDGVEKEINEQRNKHQPDLHQVWFPGVHINIGGGSNDSSYDGEGLSNIAYAWMIQMLGPYLTFEKTTWDDMSTYTRRIVEEEWRFDSIPKTEGLAAKAVNTGSWLAHAALGSLGLEKEVKLVPLPTAMIQQPSRSASIRADGKKFRWGISEYQDSYTRMYRALGASVDRIPGECLDRSTEKRTPLLKLGATNEYIHPSVEWRRYNLDFEKDSAKKYHPNSLKDYERKTDETGATGYRHKKTRMWIAEWYIKPPTSDSRKDDVWKTAEWELTKNVEDREALHKFLSDIHKANVERENRKDAGIA